MNQNFVAPLTPLELKQLDQSLTLSDAPGMDDRNIIQVHGFFSALHAAPHPVPSSVWHFLLRQQTSSPNALFILSLMQRFYHQIEQQYANEQVFEPWLYKIPYATTSVDIPFDLIGRWCQGYLEGYIFSDSLEADDAQTTHLLTPVMLLSGSLEEEEGLTPPFFDLFTEEAEYDNVKRQSWMVLPQILETLYKRGQDHRAVCPLVRGQSKSPSF